MMFRIQSSIILANKIFLGRFGKIEKLQNKENFRHIRLGMNKKNFHGHQIFLRVKLPQNISFVSEIMLIHETSFLAVFLTVDTLLIII